jgi:hypothetical protein
MKLLKIIIPFALIATLIMCTKPDNQNNNNGNSNQGVEIPIKTFILNDYKYLPGSYWIYRDSLSGRVDSFLLDQILTRNIILA